MSRLLITGTNSGCGKTTVTCALLAAFKARDLMPVAFKCGPDYLDPQFHRAVFGVSAYTLDPFFLDGAGLCSQLVARAGAPSVIEGAMGFYDGIGASDEASAFTVANETNTPAVLVINARGIGSSVGALIEGYARHRTPNTLQGVIFNNASAGFYPSLAHLAEQAGLKAYGYLPHETTWELPSRHLGLMRASEIANLQELLGELGGQAEQTLDLDGLLSLAESAPVLAGETRPVWMPGKQLQSEPAPEAEDPAKATSAAPASGEQLHAPRAHSPAKLRLAIARDEAFCFLYEENLELLEALGCELVFFSPLASPALPPDISGLYLPGGYPELHTEALSENGALREHINTAVQGGLPTIAECGGFLYLHKSLDEKPLCGVIDGEAHTTSRLQRFGYHTLVAATDNLLCERGESIRSREFHYCTSTSLGEGFTAHKAGRELSYSCVHTSSTLYAGFPHLYLPANPRFASRFVERMKLYAR